MGRKQVKGLVTIGTKAGSGKAVEITGNTDQKGWTQFKASAAKVGLKVTHKTKARPAGKKRAAAAKKKRAPAKK